MDNCPERIQWRILFQQATGLSLEAVEEATVLTMRRFLWSTRKKKIQDKTLFLLFFLPESLFVAAVDNCPERMDAADAEAPRIETAVEF